jgi:hypothetical protein
MKRETRGRKTRLGTALTKRICALLAKGSSIKSACILCNIGERTYFDWQERGKAGEQPYATFFAAATRARERHRQKLIEVVMQAADRDAKHAEWLLERQFPREFAPYERRPIPQDEPAFAGVTSVKMYCTLPSGNIASVDEMMEVARQWHEASQPHAQHELVENKPTENEPMEMWNNPATPRVEPIDNGAGED